LITAPKPMQHGSVILTDQIATNVRVLAMLPRLDAVATIMRNAAFQFFRARVRERRQEWKYECHHYETVAA
jgi:hypothetical protein